MYTFMYACMQLCICMFLIDHIKEKVNNLLHCFVNDDDDDDDNDRKVGIYVCSKVTRY